MILPLSEAKRWLRRCQVRLRQSVAAPVREKASLKAVRHLLNSSLYRKADTIAVFLSFGSEINTDSLVRRAWKDRKNVLIPITRRGPARPYFALFRPNEKMRATRFGPLEPAKNKRAFDFRKIDLVVVPGLAFDREGFRLGYGGGVYDRLLIKALRARHAGLFFSWQSLPHLPRGPHDYPMSAIVTERGVLSTVKRRGRLAKRGK